ncbi:MAG: c-type cytochrome [Planctomycetes bacterium]|nr:c-type cytochrome [Planctomycetota bacterium]
MTIPSTSPLVAVVWTALAIGSVGRTADPAPVVAAFERFARTAPDAPGHLAPAAAGRLLVGELGCVACHPSADSELAPKPGPDLSGVGTRVDPQWLAAFLAGPDEAAPGTTMPHALAAAPAAERDGLVAALVAYLSTLRAEVPLPKPSGLNPMPPAFWDRGTAATGRALYHHVGCVACHDPLPGHDGRGGPTAVEARGADLDSADRAAAGLPPLEAPFRSVALSHVGSKYTRRGLTEFLLVPLHARPAGRMPDMKLKAIEAADIAAALLEAVPGDGPARPADGVPPPPADLVDRGRTAFAAWRCNACHTTGVPSTARAATALADLDPAAPRSCIAAAPLAAGAAPVHYPLDGAQRGAIGAALGAAAGEPPPLEMALHRLNCLACHERGARGGVGSGRTAFFETLGQVDLGDEGRLPPRLDGVGARLTPAWLAKVLDGSGALRPFMLARMPVYPPQLVKPLPAALAAADRRGDDVPFPPPLPDDPAARADTFDGAARILDTGCIQCHALGEHALPGVVGVNLAGVTTRVEPAWFRRLLLHPQDVRPLTKMPAFFGDTRPRTLLDGDAERQVAAVWHWLAQKQPAPLPARIREAAASDVELVPADRPIVFRTFMTRAGTHAIAIGFPEGVHVAFDAERCRLAEAWRGRFLDARGTWILAKSAPPTDPLGAAVPIDPGPPVACLADDAAPWPDDLPVRFLGYSLDAAGVPTLRWEVAGATVRERCTPTDGGFVRSISAAVPKAGGIVAVRLATGRSLEPQEDGTGRSVVTRGDGVVVGVAPAAQPRLRDGNDGREWIVVLPADGTAVEVLYRW